VHGKLAPRYIGPYKVLKRVGAVAYWLELPEEMSDIHPVFHVSQLRRCLKVLEEKPVPVGISCIWHGIFNMMYRHHCILGCMHSVSYALVRKASPIYIVHHGMICMSL
jgi:hypothetical protein